MRLNRIYCDGALTGGTETDLPYAGEERTLEAFLHRLRALRDLEFWNVASSSAALCVAGRAAGCFRELTQSRRRIDKGRSLRVAASCLVGWGILTGISTRGAFGYFSCRRIHSSGGMRSPGVVVVASLGTNGIRGSASINPRSRFAWLIMSLRIE